MEHQHWDYIHNKGKTAELAVEVKEHLEKHHVGKRSAIVASDLATRFGFSNDRPVRLAIQYLREHGVLVLSSSKGVCGYYMAESEDEFREFIRKNYINRIKTMVANARAMTAEAEIEFGITLPGIIEQVDNRDDA